MKRSILNATSATTVSITQASLLNSSLPKLHLRPKTNLSLRIYNRSVNPRRRRRRQSMRLPCYLSFANNFLKIVKRSSKEDYNTQTRTDSTRKTLKTNSWNSYAGKPSQWSKLTGRWSRIMRSAPVKACWAPKSSSCGSEIHSWSRRSAINPPWHLPSPKKTVWCSSLALIATRWWTKAWAVRTVTLFIGRSLFTQSGSTTVWNSTPWRTRLKATA